MSEDNNSLFSRAIVTEEKDLFLYRAVVDKIIDGDTIDVTIDLGFEITKKERLRLYGINAPEKRGESKEAGLAATEYLKNLMPAGTEIVVKTYKDKKGKYGRYLASIYCDTHPLTRYGMNTVNDVMVHEGYAVKFMVD